MTKQEHLLTIVGEECSEVHQRCSKALRFGMAEIQPDQLLTNKQRILQEFNDLVAVMEMLFDKEIEDLICNDDVLAKKIKVVNYLKYSLECGTVQ